MKNEKKKWVVKKYKKRKGLPTAGAYTSGMVTRPYNNISYVPTSYRTVHRYIQVLTYDMATITGVPYIFAGNGLYDPYITGTGHQPGGYDRLAAMYRKYVVTSSKITVKAMYQPFSDTSNQGAPALAGTAVYIIPSINDLTTEITSVTDTGYREQPSTKMEILPNNMEQFTMTYYKKTADVIGFRTLYDRTYYGDNNANPGSVWYWNVGFVPLTSAISGLVTVYIDIDYYTMWTDPNDFSNS